jgi:hypothetical protein
MPEQPGVEAEKLREAVAEAAAAPHLAAGKPVLTERMRRYQGELEEIKAKAEEKESASSCSAGTW